MDPILFLTNSLTRVSQMITNLAKLMIKLNGSQASTDKRLDNLEADMRELKGELTAKPNVARSSMN